MAVEPLYLGTKHHGAVLSAEAGHDQATVRGPFGEVKLSRRAGGLLGQWLLAWAQPRSVRTLWGVQGIMQECKVSRRTVYKWIDSPGFPKPVPVVGGGAPVWEARAIEAWRKRTQKPSGRPRKAKGPGSA